MLKRRACLGEPIADLIEEERRFGCSPLEPEADGLLPGSAEELQPLAEVQALYARRAVELCGGNKTAAARALGIAVNTLKKHLRQ